MNPARTQKILVILLAAASACTLSLIVLNIVRSRSPAAAPASPSPRAPGEMGTQDVIKSGLVSVEPEAIAKVPVLFDAPAFNLTERAGNPVGSADLQGKVWIVDFIFTQCGSICPRMTASMGMLQGSLRARRDWSDIRLVSISVDPDHDTPEVLRAYAHNCQADEHQWLFLTGQRQAIWPLVRDGFKLPVEDSDKDATSPILHSGKFLLVDRRGQVRGAYDGLESQGRARLLADVARVMAETTSQTATQPATQP